MRVKSVVGNPQKKTMREITQVGCIDIGYTLINLRSAIRGKGPARLRCAICFLYYSFRM